MGQGKRMIMTIEEKARECAGITPDVSDVDRLQFSSDMHSLLAHTKYESYLAGYNEAMRWRDINEELPEINTTVLIKTTSNKYRITQLMSCEISKDNVKSRECVWKSAYDISGIITHWRPI